MLRTRPKEVSPSMVLIVLVIHVGMIIAKKNVSSGGRVSSKRACLSRLNVGAFQAALAGCLILSR